VRVGKNEVVEWSLASATNPRKRWSGEVRLLESAALSDQLAPCQPSGRSVSKTFGRPGFGCRRTGRRRVSKTL